MHKLRSIFKAVPLNAYCCLHVSINFCKCSNFNHVSSKQVLIKTAFIRKEKVLIQTQNYVNMQKMTVYMNNHQPIICIQICKMISSCLECNIVLNTVTIDFTINAINTRNIIETKT